MAGPSFVSVCLDHGHRLQIVMPDFTKLYDACMEFKRTGKDSIFLTKETCGGQAFFPVSKVAHVAMSTPQIREEDRRLEDLVAREESAGNSWE